MGNENRFNYCLPVVIIVFTVLHVCCGYFNGREGISHYVKENLPWSKLGCESLKGKLEHLDIFYRNSGIYDMKLLLLLQ